MTATQYYTATSIDGFIADEHNSLDWLFEAASGAGKTTASRGAPRRLTGRLQLSSVEREGAFAFLTYGVTACS